METALARRDEAKYPAREKQVKKVKVGVGYTDHIGPWRTL